MIHKKGLRAKICLYEDNQDVQSLIKIQVWNNTKAIYKHNLVQDVEKIAHIVVQVFQLFLNI